MNKNYTALFALLTLISLASCQDNSFEKYELCKSTPGTKQEKITGMYDVVVFASPRLVDVYTITDDGCKSEWYPPSHCECVFHHRDLEKRASCAPCVARTEILSEGRVLSECQFDGILGTKCNVVHSFPEGTEIEIKISGCHGEASAAIEIPPNRTVNLSNVAIQNNEEAILEWEPKDADEMTYQIAGNEIDKTCETIDDGQEVAQFDFREGADYSFIISEHFLQNYIVKSNSYFHMFETAPSENVSITK